MGHLQESKPDPDPVPEALALRSDLCAVGADTALREGAVRPTALLLRPHTPRTFLQAVLTPTPPK